jgi:formylglycine-generating enzyme required for sulfatase activity
MRATLIAQRVSGSIRVVLGSILAFAAGCGSKGTDSDEPDRIIDYAQFVDQTTPWGTDMVRIPAGTFTMGGGIADPADRYTDHDVTLTHDFWIGQSEVTQAQWAPILDAWDPAPSSGDPCDDCPVNQVSWVDAAMYLNALSVEAGLDVCYTESELGARVADPYIHDPYDCPGYRLPMEAEWEYAARAGVDTVYSGSIHASDVAWWSVNSGGYVHPRCGLAPNAWGFCDMSGNVQEWTNDGYDPEFGGSGDGSACTDPPGPSGTDKHRVLRGGDYHGDEFDVNVVSRIGWTYLNSSPGVGFRIARSVIP